MQATPEGLVVGDPVQELRARAQLVIPGGVNSGQRQISGIEDLVVAATNGAGFTDARGLHYTDFHAAFGPRNSWL